tara:strand:+ start:169 stop:357 length:189 start_codon:yes stop_codon:yes gene_type:complete
MGVPIVVAVNTYYGLSTVYSIWDGVGDWWRDRRGNRRTWSTPAAASSALEAVRITEVGVVHG